MTRTIKLLAFLSIAGVILMGLTIGYPYHPTARPSPFVSANTNPANLLTASASNPEDPEYCFEEKGKKDYLHRLDVDLDAINKDQVPCYGYSLWFVPNIVDALEAGAPRAEIDQRISRLLSLAGEGKFISNDEEALFKNKDGAMAIRNDIESAISEK